MLHHIEFPGPRFERPKVTVPQEGSPFAWDWFLWCVMPALSVVCPAYARLNVPAFCVWVLCQVRRSRRRCLKFTLTRTHFTLFTTTARFYSKTCLLRWFHNRLVLLFGQETQEHVKTIKKRCLEVKKRRCFIKMHLKNMFVLNFSSSSRARAGPIWAHMGPYGPTFGQMSHISDPKLNF